MYKVLILDDEPWSRKVVIELGDWERLDLCVIGEAEDGLSGIDKIGELKPDIIITDMRMPGLDGVELLMLLKEKFTELKIIVMSGYDDFSYLKQAIKSKAMEYLLKPIDQYELNAALEQCIIELNQDNLKGRLVSKVTSILVKNNSLEHYLLMRQQLKWNVLELDKAAVLSTFEKLNNFLCQNLSQLWNSELQLEIVKDLTFLIEDFIDENNLVIYKLENEVMNKWVSITDTLNNLAENYIKNINSVVIKRRNKQNCDMREIQLFINRHFMEPITLEMISHIYFISKEHLSRTFKSQTGVTINDYITKLKMEKARKLILEQKIEIKRAAETVGYTDIAYFYRVFKKYFDITPGDLRKGI